jgi:hypothetical protein
MRRASFVAAAVVVAVTLVGCGTPSPSASQAPASACADDLPARTSPTDYPLAVLYVAGDDLPPVVDALEWLGDGEPITIEPARPIHLQNFTVLQARGQPEVSLRMTDGVRIASWRVEAIPGGLFRSGDLETDRVQWAAGDGPTDIVCVPIRDGEWAIVADITFADDAGNATYYWRLNISETPDA